MSTLTFAILVVGLLVVVFALAGYALKKSSDREVERLIKKYNATGKQSETPR